MPREEVAQTQNAQEDNNVAKGCMRNYSYKVMSYVIQGTTFCDELNAVSN
jgi:hypothetical protein